MVLVNTLQSIVKARTPKKSYKRPVAAPGMSKVNKAAFTVDKGYWPSNAEMAESPFNTAGAAEAYLNETYGMTAAGFRRFKERAVNVDFTGKLTGTRALVEKALLDNKLIRKIRGPKGNMVFSPGTATSKQKELTDLTPNSKREATTGKFQKAADRAAEVRKELKKDPTPPKKVPRKFKSLDDRILQSPESGRKLGAQRLREQQARQQARVAPAGESEIELAARLYREQQARQQARAAPAPEVRTLDFETPKKLGADGAGRPPLDPVHAQPLPKGTDWTNTDAISDLYDNYREPPSFAYDIPAYKEPLEGKYDNPQVQVAERMPADYPFRETGRPKGYHPHGKPQQFNGQDMVPATLDGKPYDIRTRPGGFDPANPAPNNPNIPRNNPNIPRGVRPARPQPDKFGDYNPEMIDFAEIPDAPAPPNGPAFPRPNLGPGVPPEVGAGYAEPLEVGAGPLVPDDAMGGAGGYDDAPVQGGPVGGGRVGGITGNQLRTGVGVATHALSTLGEELTMNSHNPNLSKAGAVGRAVGTTGAVVGTAAASAWAGATGAALAAVPFCAMTGPILAPACEALAGIGGGIAGFVGGAAAGKKVTQGIYDVIDMDENGAGQQTNPEFPVDTITDGGADASATGTAATTDTDTSSAAGATRPGPAANGAYPERTAAGNKETQVGQDEKGDYFATNPVNNMHDFDSMRQGYGIATARDVIPSSKKQLESDIRFDMFDQVQPGFGNGGDNKMFLMDQARDRQIRYRGPMNYPGSYIGPTSGVGVAPWQLQRTFPLELAQKFAAEETRKSKLGAAVLTSNPLSKSLGLLGDDLGYPYDYSSKSLKRNRLSPFEPIIRNDFQWTRVKEATGHELNKKRFRLSTDAERYPEKLVSSTSMMGGPTFNKRTALEVILP
jgi:hypothetical protein